MQSDALHGGTRPDAGLAVRRRADDVADAIEALRETDHLDAHAELVHRLRVAARRALVALDLCGLSRDNRAWRNLRRRIRALRRAGGIVRDCDVHAQLLRTLRDQPGSPPAVAEALGMIEHDRALALGALLEALTTHKPAAIRRNARRVRDAVRTNPSADQRRSMTSPARGGLAEASLRLEAAAAADLSQPPNLHELRLAVKALRYTHEVRLTADRSSRSALDHSVLAAAQTRLGEVNDIATLVARLARYRDGAGPQPADGVSHHRETLGMLHDRFATVLAARCAAAAAWWRDMESLRPTDVPLAQYLAGPATEPSPQRKEVPPMIDVLNPVTAEPQLARTAHPEPSSQANLWVAGLTIGVIDVGSNSIRLLVVEMIDERSWRVLAEERSMTRLAHGLAMDGNLSTEAMAVSVEAVDRFRKIASERGATDIRAFATAAVRDARNGDEFVSLVKDRTGLTLNIVSAAEEGRLTFRSVSRIQDLSHGTAVVVDMGGGSMEVVSSDGGVITRNDSMRLGAVRITEQFGGAEASAGVRFKEMRRYIGRTIAAHVPQPEIPPAVLAGCGGTFTTILTIAAAERGILLERNGRAPKAPSPVSREQVRDLIARLRRMTLEQRLRVPGLPSDRADIVIAGLVAVERLMKHLGSTQLMAHPGGVREGLVMRIFDEHLAARVQGADCPESRLIEEARDLAKRCRYDQPHSEHVCALALSLYDQFLRESALIPDLGSEPDERALLAASALLHDIGIMVEYRRHHKHSARIIRHTGLPSCTPRQVELIAQVSRYHRSASPSPKHAAFAALPPKDQDLVRRLSAILRVADGFDRPHAQAARSVQLRFAKNAVRLEPQGEGDLIAETKGAAKKAALLGAVCKLAVEFSPAMAPRV